jgi:hypothetical protein
MLTLRGMSPADRGDDGRARKLRNWKLRSSKPPKTRTQVALRAELFGSTAATAADLTATGTAPVLALCRQLLAAGLDPDRALEVYRGAVLALRVRSIGEAAGLEINSKASGFICHRAVRPASKVRSNHAAPSKYPRQSARAETGRAP